jgi:molybdate transport system substrate-binding protein
MDRNRRLVSAACLATLGGLVLPGCASRVPLAQEQPTLHILSGGAAMGLVDRLRPAFEAQHGCRISGTYGAVGLMREKLLAGEPCDLLILSQSLITNLEGSGHADVASSRPVGHVKTGIALMEGRAPVTVRNEADLKALLASASALYFPDPAKATAGIHFMKVLKSMGLDRDTAKLRPYPNGNTAMAAMAKAGDPNAIGCTQVTEIIITPGVKLTGLLPPPHELSTVYTASVAKSAKQAQLAQALIARLTAAEHAETRRISGFV